MVSYIWTAITSVNSAKIILRLPGPLGPTRLPLQLLFSMEILVCAGHNSNITTEVGN